MDTIHQDLQGMYRHFLIENFSLFNRAIKLDEFLYKKSLFPVKLAHGLSSWLSLFVRKKEYLPRITFLFGNFPSVLKYPRIAYLLKHLRIVFHS